ncbi:MAG TPA: HD domain-containing phosphohydrolase [Solirubrobacteraceae bacterium]|nr:HD domain-containing phosphohydrolase [Solirubrobacteraceae bacterium]
MLVIALVALWGWVSGGIALVLVPVLAGAFVLAEAEAWLRRRVAQRRAAAAEERDTLTGMPSRRRLAEDIAAFMRTRRGDAQLTLYVFDLVGYKKYNDAFGYAAGDAMLRHLCARLVATVGPAGGVYRLRGPQFAVATVAGPVEATRLRQACVRALSEIGEGFLIGCAWGSASLPRQARALPEALKLADQEVQAERGALRREGIDETTIAPAPTGPRLEPSPYEVAGLAAAVGLLMGLDRVELQAVQTAAAQRDVGMIALPDAIVNARGPLTPEQRAFVELHTLVGERLLRANLGLDEVSAIVRSTHERWDGGGYPDGLSGEEIPLGARIVAVCAAFQDMTSPRAHRPALIARQAIEELRRGSGAQFDPHIVAAFVDAFEESPETRPPSVGSEA